MTSQSEANEGPFEFKTEAAPSENTVSELSGNSLWILAFNYNVFIEKADLLFRQVFRRGVRVQVRNFTRLTVHFTFELTRHFVMTVIMAFGWVSF